MRTEIKGANILVTGGAGFIGSHLVDGLIEKGARKLVAVDNLFLGKEENLAQAVAQGAVFVRDDVELEGTLDYLLEEHKIDIVFHCATKALNYSFLNPSNAYMTNVNMMKNLLELQRRGAFTTLCHFSSSEVYGSALYEPMDENHPYRATTTYAAGKAAADLMLYSYVQQYGLDAFIVRPFNNYGPRQNFEGPLSGIIPATARHIFNGEPPEVHGTGEQSREFVYVLDTVAAVLALYPLTPKGEAVNIAADGQTTMNDLVAMIIEQLGYSGEVLRKPARVADVFCHNASSEKLKGLISFEPTPFAEGLAQTLEWYKKNILAKA